MLPDYYYLPCHSRQQAFPLSSFFHSISFSQQITKRLFLNPVYTILPAFVQMCGNLLICKSANLQPSQCISANFSLFPTPAASVTFAQGDHVPGYTTSLDALSLQRYNIVRRCTVPVYKAKQQSATSIGRRHHRMGWRFITL